MIECGNVGVCVNVRVRVRENISVGNEEIEKEV